MKINNESRSAYANRIVVTMFFLFILSALIHAKPSKEGDIQVGQSPNPENTQTGQCDSIGFESPLRLTHFRNTPSDSFALGDFNNDGFQDVVVSGGILLGVGDGTFVSGGCHQIGERFIAADVDSDGNLDIVGPAGGAGTVKVEFGDGHGNFISGPTSPAGNIPVTIAIADLNLDSKPDLVATNANNGQISVLIGLGNGAFLTPVSYPAGNSPRDVLIDDFNGDNISDVIVANATTGAQTVSVLVGNGDGTFLPRIASFAGTRPGLIQRGDLDGDGILDVVTTHLQPDPNEFYANKISILIGFGDGSFRAPVDIKVGPIPAGIVIEDFNNDNHLDIGISIREEVNGILILEGIGNGSFLTTTAFMSSPNSGGVLTADFNQDGNPDLASLSVPFGYNTQTPPDKSVAVILGDGNGRFRDTGEIYLPGNDVYSVDGGDLNLDGYMDLVVIDYLVQWSGARVRAILRNANGAVISKQLFDLPFLNGEYKLRLGDVNNDGYEDIVTSTSVLLNDQTGNFHLPILHQELPGSIQLGDFNSDGILDIVGTSSSSSGFTLLTGYGNGSFGPGVLVPLPFPSPNDLHAADFNSDTYLDVVASGRIFLGNGDGTFSSGQSANTGSIIDDFNNDGRLDFASTAAGNIWIKLGDGTGGFGSNISTVFTQPLILAYNSVSGDFDGDNIADIAIGSLSSVYVSKGNGDGTFQEPIRQTSAKRSKYLLALDFNNDGRNDVAASAYNGGIAILYSRCPRKPTEITVTSTGNPSTVGAPVTITATVTADGVPVTVGGVVFKDFCNVYEGPVTLNQNGSASITVTNLNIGTNGFDIEYGGSESTLQAESFFVQNIIVQNPPSISGTSIELYEGTSSVGSIIAQVNDFEDAAATLALTVNGQSSAMVNGVSVSNISVDHFGRVTADVVASCNATNTSFALEVTDSGGMTASGSLVVIINENLNPVVTISSPASGVVHPVGTTVNFTGAFTDNLGGTHTSEWVFDSINQAGNVVEPTASTAGLTNTSYTFTQAGVYLVNLTINDGCGGSGTSDTVNELAAMVVIYDPEGGFVTGGGWIDSPLGAYRENPSLTGKASFGFVSKYKKGANVPTGNTEFQFRSGDLNFKSSIYDWLVVAGARAQYSGSGTINGAGDYRFMLTAIDGQVNGGGGVDKFRMRIWNNSSGGIVYDNQVNGDTSDSATPSTVIGGGNIVIHK